MDTSTNCIGKDRGNALNAAWKTKEYRSDVILVDSGASQHMTSEMAYCNCIEKITPMEVGLANGQVFSASQKSKVSVKVGKTEATVSSVHLIPELRMSLKYYPRVNQNGVTITISHGCFKFVHRIINNWYISNVTRQNGDGLLVAELIP